MNGGMSPANRITHHLGAAGPGSPPAPRWTPPPLTAAGTASTQASAAPSSAVELVGVTKRFGTAPALDELDLSVPTGSITVLVGPNGAGKTTAIRTMTGALTPEHGIVRTFGLDPDLDGRRVRQRCGVVSAKPALYDRLSGTDNLRYAAELYGLGRHCDDRIRTAAARFGIDHALDKQVGSYSTGMKTRLALARSVLHEPELLLFDEPTAGLDPESSAAVLSLIREMTADGSTVVLCTHHLVEAEGLADQVVMLEDGHALVAGTPEELARHYWPGGLVHFDAEDRTLLRRLEGAPGVVKVDLHPDGADVVLDDPSLVPDLIAGLTTLGVRLTRVDPHVPTLEDLYFAVRRDAANHRRLREANAGAEPLERPR
jgi:ABC-2 type transport system ATP-binding protein